MLGPRHIEWDTGLMRSREYAAYWHDNLIFKARRNGSRLDNCLSEKYVKPTRKKKNMRLNELERLAGIQKDNNILLERLMKIKEGPDRLNRRSRSTKVLGKNTVTDKLRAEEIDRDNEQLARRLVRKLPWISKKRLDKDYNKSREYHNNISKVSWLHLSNLVGRSRSVQTLMRQRFRHPNPNKLKKKFSLPRFGSSKFVENTSTTVN